MALRSSSTQHIATLISSFDATRLVITTQTGTRANELVKGTDWDVVDPDQSRYSDSRTQMGRLRFSSASSRIYEKHGGNACSSVRDLGGGFD